MSSLWNPLQYLNDHSFQLNNVIVDTQIPSTRKHLSVYHSDEDNFSNFSPENNDNAELYTQHSIQSLENNNFPTLYSDLISDTDLEDEETNFRLFAIYLTAF